MSAQWIEGDLTITILDGLQINSRVYHDGNEKNLLLKALVLLKRHDVYYGRVNTIKFSPLPIYLEI